jgi:hypothetical protein
MTFSSRAQFEAAVAGGLTVEDFTDTFHFPISTGELNSTTNLPAIGITPGMIKPGVTYSTPVGSGNFFNINFGGLYSGGFLDGAQGQVLTVKFDSATSALGFDAGGLGANGFDITLKFVDNSLQTLSYNYPTAPQFFGFQSNGLKIDSAILANTGSGGKGFDLDKFTFAPASVPEPATGMLALFGFYSLLNARRRR